jgi:hypothetical protein
MHATAALESLAAVPRIAEQSGDVGDRLTRLSRLPAWPSVLGGLSVPATPKQICAVLAGLVDAATLHYLLYGHGNGIMLVHSATAPSAVLRTLPALDVGLWAPSLAAAWAASSALIAIYAATEPAERPQLPQPPTERNTREEIVSDAFAQAVAHGDEHVIKFADTAIQVFARTDNPDAIAAAFRAGEIIEL